MYLDIEQKVDALLHTAHPLHTSDSTQEECKDYLKMLHSIVNGEWSSEKSAEDDKVLLLHSDALIVRTILSLGQSMGLQVIAECVETQAQRDFLERHGCNAFQGYLFARPMPVAAWAPWIRLPTPRNLS